MSVYMTVPNLDGTTIIDVQPVANSQTSHFILLFVLLFIVYCTYMYLYSMYTKL